MKKTRYVQVGIGGRARLFYGAIIKDYKDTAEVTGFCDINRKRMEYACEAFENAGLPAPKLYGVDEFEKMIEEQKPDCVIVTSIDRTHHKYIVKAMEMGCDVISEKPMTMDADKCQQIIDAIERTGKKLRVTFNYRYAPHNSIVRKLIKEDIIGKINQIHFEWNLNTRHGADYFRRWHRDKRNSGGLLVHKSTHHFDLVNFWLGDIPKTVYAQGDLMFYGRENAEERGVTKFYSRTYGSEYAKDDPFAIVLEGCRYLEKTYLEAESEDGYIRDQSVFGDNISIEDTMCVMVRYKKGTMMSYSLNAYSPYEGFRVVFTGTKGRMELDVVESVYVNGEGDPSEEGVVKGKKLTVYPMFDEPYNVEIEEGIGGHGGGDKVMLCDIFSDNPPYDELKRAASHIDGVYSIMTGICANKSIATGLPVKVEDMIDLK